MTGVVCERWSEAPARPRLASPHLTSPFRPTYGTDDSTQVPELQDPRRTGTPFRLRWDRLFRDERDSHGGHERDEPLGVYFRWGIGGDGRGYYARSAAGPDSGVLASGGGFVLDAIYVWFVREMWGPFWLLFTVGSFCVRACVRCTAVACFFLVSVIPLLFVCLPFVFSPLAPFLLPIG